jgi:hypothetical protein
MEDLERVLIEKQCERLVNQYYHLFNRELSLVAELFSENGVLNIGGWKNGPDWEKSIPALQGGSRNMLRGKEVVLNTMSNIVVDAVDEDHATGVAYDAMWETPYPDDEFAGRPAPMRRPKFMDRWDDEFIRENGVWKFENRKMEILYYADWARK